jgi:heme/copper-type cytochrome/quinol oxidase subunit 4
LVLLYFMHLKYDNSLFAMPMILGFVLAIPIILVIVLVMPLLVR